VKRIDFQTLVFMVAILNENIPQLDYNERALAASSHEFRAAAEIPPLHCI
jgi:hypothetical protein